MSEHTKLFERAGALYEPPDLPMDGLLKRRDRNRRNQRIAAGVVGIAVFAGLVWIVTNGLSFDRTQTPAVPGGAETGPAVTGQSGTGDFYSEDFSGLPPEGAVASNPDEGEVVADFAKIHVGFVYVYADGRVIWMRAATGSIYEQRLTPEGVDLVLSGDVKPPTFLDAWFGPDAVGLPAGAWARIQRSGRMCRRGTRSATRIRMGISSIRPASWSSCSPQSRSPAPRQGTDVRPYRGTRREHPSCDLLRGNDR